MQSESTMTLQIHCFCLLVASLFYLVAYPFLQHNITGNLPVFTATHMCNYLTIAVHGNGVS